MGHCSANTNCWDTAAATVLPRSSADFMVLQETKRIIHPDDPTLLQRKGRNLGWNVQASSARPTAAQRASGGCVVGARRGCGISDHANLVSDGFQHRLHLAWVGGILRGGLHLGSIWLKDCEGLSPTNLAILDAAAAALGRIRGPWLLGGDWNITPEELHASGWLDVVDGLIVASLSPPATVKSTTSSLSAVAFTMQ